MPTGKLSLADRGLDGLMIEWLFYHQFEGHRLVGKVRAVKKSDAFRSPPSSDAVMESGAPANRRRECCHTHSLDPLKLYADSGASRPLIPG
jgi:hypothetical protein